MRSTGFDNGEAGPEPASVFREIKNVKQEAGRGRRRWFESDGIELVVWLDRDEAVEGFQICYNLGQGEHALTWRVAGGFVHSAVDAGDTTPLANLTPILVPDGRAPWADIRRLFSRASGSLEPSLREWVQGKLGDPAELQPGTGPAA